MGLKKKNKNHREQLRIEGVVVAQSSGGLPALIDLFEDLAWNHTFTSSAKSSKSPLKPHPRQRHTSNFKGLATEFPTTPFKTKPTFNITAKRS
jgi:hypothetical protein